VGLLRVLSDEILKQHGGISPNEQLCVIYYGEHNIGYIVIARSVATWQSQLLAEQEIASPA